MTDSRIELEQEIRSMAKVELHRHLEGSLRLETILELACQDDLGLPREREALKAMVQMCPGEPRTAQRFLAKFKALRPIYRSPEVIVRVAREAVEDAAADHVRYLELRFTPAALARVRRFALADVVDWVLESARQAAQDKMMELRFIISINRHEPVSLAEEVAQIAVDRKDDGVVGLDMAGDESNYDGEAFMALFRQAAVEGLGITVHASEWAGAGGVRMALEKLGAQRIGHGIRVLEDREVTALARERGAVFEVCPTSNVQSGVVSDWKRHPLPRMLQAGLPVTLNSDDPAISGITLSDEYLSAVREMGLSLVTLQGMVMTAVQAAFLPKRERRRIEVEMEAALIGFPPQEP